MRTRKRTLRRTRTNLPKLASASTVEAEAPSIMFCRNLLWDEPAESGAARVHHSLVHHHGSVYAFGGMETGKRSSQNSVWEYEMVTGRWSELHIKHGKAPGKREGHSAVVYKGCMYVYGGHKGMSFFGDLHKLDISAKQWERLEEQSGSPTPGPRFGHAAMVAREQMWIAGGFCRDSGARFLTSYSFAWNAWSDHEGPPGVRLATVTRPTIAYHDGKVYVLGLRQEPQESTNVFSYDCDQGVWAEIRCGGVPPVTFSNMIYGYAAGVHVPGHRTLFVFVVPPGKDAAPQPNQRRQRRRSRRESVSDIPVGLFALSFDTLQWSWVPIDGAKLGGGARLADYKTKYGAVCIGDRILIHGGAGSNDRILAALSAQQDWSGLRMDLSKDGTARASPGAGSHPAPVRDQSSDEGSGNEDSARARRMKYLTPIEQKRQAADEQLRKARNIDRSERKISFWRMVDTGAKKSPAESETTRRRRVDDDNGFVVPFVKDFHMPGALSVHCPVVLLRTNEEVKQWEEGYYVHQHDRVLDMHKTVSRDERSRKPERRDDKDFTVSERMYSQSPRRLRKSPALRLKAGQGPLVPKWHAPDEVIQQWEMGRGPLVCRSDLQGEDQQPADAPPDSAVLKKRAGDGWSVVRSVIFPNGVPKAPARGKRIKKSPAPLQVGSPRAGDGDNTRLTSPLPTSPGNRFDAASQSSSRRPSSAGADAVSPHLVPHPPTRSPRQRAQTRISPGGRRPASRRSSASGPARPTDLSMRSDVGATLWAANTARTTTRSNASPASHAIGSRWADTIGSARIPIGAPAKSLPDGWGPDAEPPQDPSSPTVWMRNRSWRDQWDYYLREGFGELPPPPPALRGVNAVRNIVGILNISRMTAMRESVSGPSDP